jgi:hypothetical protein
VGSQHAESESAECESGGSGETLQNAASMESAESNKANSNSASFGDTPSKHAYNLRSASKRGINQASWTNSTSQHANIKTGSISHSNQTGPTSKRSK